MAQCLPNVIYILADDMGYGDTTCLNPDSKICTPNIDSIAANGMRFTDAHSASAVCTPSRYSILTGRYSWRSRLKSSVIGGYTPSLIEHGRMTVASMLRECGYRTGCVGKWHLGLDWTRCEDAPETPNYGETPGIDYCAPFRGGPVDHGFDRFYGIAASLDMPPYVYLDGDKVKTPPNHITQDTGKRFWRKGPTAPDFDHEQVLPELVNKALSWIDEWAGQPFFIYFPLPAPHTPILPTAEFKGKSGIGDYGDFVLMCDDVVGQIRRKLEELGLTDNTILIFTSDNGCSPMADFQELASHGHHPSYVFRGYKADIYEGGHRIPLVVSWPDKIKPGSKSNQPICLVDLMATLAQIVGISLPDNAGEDSVSNLPIWLGTADKPIRDAVVHHSINGSFSIRKGKWKLELCPGSGGWSEPRPGEESPDAPRVQLYDLDDDISERRNRADEYPQLVAEMTRLLIRYIADGRSTCGAPQENIDPDFFYTYDWYRPDVLTQ